jgi:alpha-beta hydrolase superfamily lysophospholipase
VLRLLHLLENLPAYFEAVWRAIPPLRLCASAPRCGSNSDFGVDFPGQPHERPGVTGCLSAEFRGSTVGIGRWVGCALALGLAACAPKYTPVNYINSPVVAPDGGDQSETFGYRRWIDPKVEPDVIVIGIHGFCGASIDYANLGRHLLAHQPQTGLYAYEVRGQGSDPIRERRGDIGDPADWYRDLLAFTQLVRERHPEAKVVWCGESMGGLIASHALRSSQPGDEPCDALILTSPVVRIRDDVPQWKVELVKIAAAAFPLARVSLDALSGGQQVQMTQTATHGEQSQHNSYNVEDHTLRLLGTLGRHITGMNDCAASFRVPVLVLHGGKDFFNSDADVRGFVAHIPPEVSSTYRNYPDAFHLLMYDAQNDRIFRDLEAWLNRRRHAWR